MRGQSGNPLHGVHLHTHNDFVLTELPT